MTTPTIDNAAALADLVRECKAKNLPIIDYGVAHNGLGNPPPAGHTRLTQSGGIIEHYDRDMTVRVSAGMTMGALQQALAATNQFLPLDTDDDVTVGEALVHNVYGPLRQTYGSLRDLTLGLHYIDGDSRDIHVGGRTVKNVAGYDVTRFMVGSLGQCGIVHEATIRTYAIPEQVLAVILDLEDPAYVNKILTDWMLSDAAPSWMELQRLEAQWKLSVGYLGRPTANSSQFESLKTFLAAHDPLTIVDSAPGTLNDDLAERRLRSTWRRRSPALVKVVVPPAATGVTCRFLAQAMPKLMIDALPTHGRIFAGGDLDAMAVASLDALITEHVIDYKGFRVWHQRPAGAENLAPFAPRQNDWALLNRIHKTMDPHQLFNPRRFLPVECDPS